MLPRQQRHIHSDSDRGATTTTLSSAVNPASPSQLVQITRGYPGRRRPGQSDSHVRSTRRIPHRCIVAIDSPDTRGSTCPSCRSDGTHRATGDGNFESSTSTNSSTVIFPVAPHASSANPWRSATSHLHRPVTPRDSPPHLPGCSSPDGVEVSQHAARRQPPSRAASSDQANHHAATYTGTTASRSTRRHRATRSPRFTDSSQQCERPTAVSIPELPGHRHRAHVGTGPEPDLGQPYYLSPDRRGTRDIQQSANIVRPGRRSSYT